MSCWKKQYTYRQAKEALRIMKRLKSPYERPKRIYKCQCGWWHVTSRKERA